MDLRKLILVPALALSAFITGCGDDCTSVCEDSKDCADADKSTDCDKACDESKKAADEAGCSDQYDDLLSCLSDIDDLCKSDGTECIKETLALSSCTLKYCEAHPDASVCTADTSQ